MVHTTPKMSTLIWSKRYFPFKLDLISFHSQLY